MGSALPLKPVVLEGRFVRLEPLSMGHLGALCKVGMDERIWKWTSPRVRKSDDMRALIESALAQQAGGGALAFATVDRGCGQAVGSTRFFHYDQEDRRVEIGYTWLGVDWQRTYVNTEAKYLMLRHAFEVSKLQRVELKTDVLNDRSRAAILRLGAKQEGIFRKHMVMPGGRVRDSVYFSIVDDEWPAVKAGLEGKLGG